MSSIWSGITMSTLSWTCRETVGSHFHHFCEKGISYAGPPASQPQLRAFGIRKLGNKTPDIPEHCRYEYKRA